MYTKLSMASNKTAHVKIGKKKAFPAVVRCVTDRYLNFVLPCKDNVIACCRTDKTSHGRKEFTKENGIHDHES
jgi:hypothetical protein